MAGFGGAVKLTGESEYRRALNQITQNLKEVNSELKVVTSAYDKNDKSASSITQQTEILTKKLNEQSDKLKVLSTRYNEINDTYGKNSKAQKELTDELTKEKAKLEEIGRTLGTSSKEYQEQEKVVSSLENKQEAYNKTVSDAKIKMNQAQAEVNKTTREIDELGKETHETTEEVKKSSDGFTVFKGVLANLSTKAISTAVSGIKKLGNTFVSLTKASVGSYAEYEQLVGGVETLFKKSAPIVQKYAEQAYKTAGLSANEYMATVTSFSASLLQGLKNNTKKAADYANMAIVDMSDNANKMGTSMEMIQNAYQGFAKQNYTMLDNLKLGFGGTKSEMARLVKESGVLGKAGKDLTAKNLDQKVSFDQIVLAIHKTQQKMGIAGTTSKEAATTIEGSTNSMKASWNNLLTAIADDNKDMGKAVDDFVDSAATAAKNLVPRIKKSIEGIKKLINSIVTEVFPKLKREVPELKPLIEVFEWFIKNKNLVVNSIKVMVAAFTVAKINQFTKSLTDGAKSLINIAKGATTATAATTANTAATVANTTATTLGTAATTAMSAAQNLLNAAWKSNPIGLVITGVTALAGVYQLLKGRTDEITNAHKKAMDEISKESDAIKENKDAYNDLLDAQQKQVNASMTQMAHYESLYDELVQITDANGKVKKGYEQRASFIVSTLKDALGVEISMNKGVISGYEKIKGSIEKVIAQKKAKIILDSQEKLYQEALTKEQEVTAKMSEYATKVKENETKIDELRIQKANARTQYEAANIQRRINNLEKENTEIEKNYKEQESLLKQYAYNKGQYEKNMELFHKGQYDKMTNVSWEYVKDMEKVGESEKAQLEKQKKDTEIHLNTLYKLKSESGSKIYDSQIKADEKLLNQYDKALAKYEEATVKNGAVCEEDWKVALGKQVTAITGVKTEFKDAGNGNVQMYANGMKMGQPMTLKQAEQIAAKTVNTFDNKKPSFTSAGKNALLGIKSGLDDKNTSSSLYNRMSTLGDSLLSRFNKSLGIHSPSRKMMESAKYMLQGITKGIDKEEGNVISKVDSFSSDLVSAMNEGLSENIRLSGVQAKATTTGSNENFYNGLINAFKDALKDMKIELNDEEVGSFVDKTVSKLIYN